MSNKIPIPLTFLALTLTLGPARGQTHWPDLSDAGTVVGGGAADAAVIVGIESYAAAPAVPGAVDNARQWYGWLTRARGLAPDRIQLLTDRYGTVERMKKALATAAKDVQPGGTLWVVYVGHGAPAKSGDDGIFVGFDAQQDPDSLYARSLAQREALAIIDGARPADTRTVMVVDACFSGRSSEGGALVEGLQPLLPVARQRGPGAGVTILSAGSADQFAGPLPGLERPAFSYLVLGALRGWADDDGDGQVTASEAVGYARSTLRAVVRGRTQTPELVGADGVLAPSAREAGPDIAGVVLERSISAGSEAGAVQVRARKKRSLTTFPGHDTFSVDLAYQLGPSDNATVHALDLGLTGSLGPVELVGRAGYAFGTFKSDDSSVFASSASVDKDLEGIHLSLALGLRIVSWQDADFHDLSLVNLSAGVFGEGIIPISDGGGGNVGAYLANTFYLSCDVGARVSYAHGFLPDDVSGPVPSHFSVSVGLLAEREGCR